MLRHQRPHALVLVVLDGGGQRPPPVHPSLPSAVLRLQGRGSAVSGRRLAVLSTGSEASTAQGAPSGLLDLVPTEVPRAASWESTP